MNPSDTAQVLTKLAAFDQRTIAAEDVMAWHEVIGHLQLPFCLQAVTAHYREHSHRAMPADIRKLATDAQARQRGIADRAQRQIQASSKEPPRTGAAMVRFVLDRLRSAGQDVITSRFLGRDRAADIAERACREWLDLTADLDQKAA